MTALRAVLARCLRHLPSAASDRTLLQAHAAGDPDAFRALVERHGPMVLRLCRRLLGDRHAADDAFQATFLVLARRGNSLRRPDALASWLFGVARRVALKARSASARRQRYEARVLPPSHTEPPDELTARELFDALDDELTHLPERYRLPLLLTYWQGLTQEETARRLGWTPGSVKGRLERGRARLAQRLTRRGFGPSAILAAPLATTAVPRELLTAAVGLASSPWSASIPAAVLALAATGITPKLLTAVAVVVALTGAGLVGAFWRAGSVSDRRIGNEELFNPPVAHAPGSPAEQAQRLDLSGDPLPDGAIARIGTNRLARSGAVMAFSPDGRLFAVGAGFGTEWVHIWETKTGKLVSALKAEERRNPVTELTFSPDSRLLAVSGFWDKEVLVWDISSGQVLHRLPNTTEDQGRWARWGENPTLAFTPDSKTLIGGGKDGGVYLWDLATGQETAHIKLDAHTVIALTITADASLALTAHSGALRADGDLHLWDLARRQHIRRLDARSNPPGKGAPQMASLSPDGKTYVVCANLEQVEVRQTSNDRVLHRLADPRQVVGLAFATDGTLWIARDGGDVTAWDVNTGQQRRSVSSGEIAPHSQPRSPNSMNLTEAWFSPDCRSVAWRGTTTRIWDLTTGQETPTFGGHRENVNWVSFTPDGQTLWTGGGKAEVGTWDAATGLERSPRRSLAPLPSTSSWLAVRYYLSADRRRAAFVTSSPQGENNPYARVIYLWEPAADRPTEAQVVEPAGATEFPKAIMTPDGRFVVAIENIRPPGIKATSMIRVYDAATRQLVRTFAGREYESRLAMTPDGTVLVAAGDHPEAVRLYDFATGKPLRDLSVPSPASKMAISPDGQILACGYSDVVERMRAMPNEPLGVGPVVILWHVASGRELYRIPTERNSFSGELAFSPDARLLLRGGDDGVVRLWEVASGQDRRKYEGHERGVRSVDFATDGRRFASGGQDGTALVWQVFDPGPAELTDAELAAKWADLAGEPTAAHRAIGALLSAKSGVPFLAKQLPPAAAPPADRLAQLIAALDSPQPAAREEAEKELARLTDTIAPALWQAIGKKPSDEARPRIEKLLRALEIPVANAELLRQLRSVEVLEHAGTPEARRALERLASGDADARLTRAARASLERLKRRP